MIQNYGNLPQFSRICILSVGNFYTVKGTYMSIFDQFVLLFSNVFMTATLRVAAITHQPH